MTRGSGVGWRRTRLKDQPGGYHPRSQGSETRLGGPSWYPETLGSGQGGGSGLTDLRGVRVSCTKGV